MCNRTCCNCWQSLVRRVLTLGVQLLIAFWR